MDEFMSKFFNVTMKELASKASADLDLKRENGNIDGESAMGTMLRYGSEAAKAFYKGTGMVSPDIAEAHDNGDIHIHDLDFFNLTTTCCQIDLKSLLARGFNTGHGYLRPPSNIQSAAALACIAIQSNQNDQHGGQSIPAFDYALAPYVRKSFIKNICKVLDVRYDFDEDDLEAIRVRLSEIKGDIMGEVGEDMIGEILVDYPLYDFQVHGVVSIAYDMTERETYQAMEALVHNLNTMHSRAGAQVPFSSLNYGTDTSTEGRMVIEQILLAEEAGLGNGETPIFPIHIFKVRAGKSADPTDKNYDLFQLACKVSAKRLFPNFSFMDAPFNAQYLTADGDPNNEVAYMGCRTRVMANNYDKQREQTFGRGNLSFTSINLPRLGLKHRGDINGFFAELGQVQDLVFRQLEERLKAQGERLVRNAPFLMKQGVWLDSEKLKDTDKIAEVLKHGTLTTGFIGLAECLVALIGQHHGESHYAQQLGLRIISFLRHKSDLKTQETGLNFTLIATPAEGLSGRFVKLDRKIYGEIPGITDRDYYTNSFHVPVYYKINAARKISIEAPYHAMTNGGHISYVEVDGNPLNNLKAFEDIIQHMRRSGMGYGSINHPVDHDPVCGYTGIIGDTCPKCGRKESDGPKFERIRRITGYLVGTLDRFNDGKRAEERDRVKHEKMEKF